MIQERFFLKQYIIDLTIHSIQNKWIVNLVNLNVIEVVLNIQSTSSMI